ncbi:LacI family DNA-binding transcriptional regulator [Paenibacillus sepulcri]|uniref:LacI family transcriptional regulator n=1 Tax=Paenibacillus sepulcri TaxID=359917 RepID=A0ABS7BY63_9BACL|nr:LacI family transcriptional regulator [Paenibacillus sepulcri]
MSVTILDIAKVAGVSKSTVSLVINESDKVKLETRHKVWQTINDLGYVPNMAARALTTSRTKTLGLIFLTSDETSLPYAMDSVPETLLYDVTYGINACLRNTDYSLLTERFSVSGHAKLPDLIKNKRVDGVFLIGGLYDDAFINLVLKQGIHVVIIGRHQEGVDSVSVNANKVGYLGAKYLLEQGHKQIAFISGPAHSSISQDKQNGFAAAVAELGISMEQIYFMHSPYTGLGGYQTLKQLWNDGIKPTAIFGGSDGITAGIILFLYEQGISVPKDISIISYEESLLSTHAPFSLTVIDGHKIQLGEMACMTMINRIKKQNAQEVTLIIEPSFILRNSVRSLI